MDEPAFDVLRRLCDRKSDGVRPAALLVLAHPGDESLGAATLLPALGGSPLVYVTDGAGPGAGEAQAHGCPDRESYAARRRGELISALDSIGIPRSRIHHVDLVAHEAPRFLVPLTLWIEILLREQRPSIVLTHPYDGTDADRDATAFAVHRACGRVRDAGFKCPVVAEFALTNAANEARFVGMPDATAVFTRQLTPAEATLKRRLLGCFATYRASLPHYSLRTECFRVAPAYDFTQVPAAPGRDPAIHTDVSEEWEERARHALEELSHAGPSFQ